MNNLLSNAILLFSGDQAIFISGGVNPTEDSDIENSTEVLDLENSTCSRTTADLPDNRNGHSSHLLNNSEVVMCGGVYTASSCIVTSTPTAGGWRNHSTLTEDLALIHI